MASWGNYNNDGVDAGVPAGLTGVTQVAAGTYHSLALKGDGTVVAWGDNESQQTSVPAALTGVTQVAAGGYHSLALRGDGTVVGWGSNWSGQADVPAGLGDVVQVAAGDEHSLALKGDGTVVGWGWGNWDEGASKPPAWLQDVIQVAAGGEHSLALRSDGTVVAWGNSEQGQAAVPYGLSDVIQVAAGGYHSLALRGDGTVVAWGSNSNGQASVPAGLSDVTQVAAGRLHSLALRNDGTVVAWGYNYNGQATVPTGLGGVVQVSAGGWHSLALVPVSFSPGVGRTVVENAGTIQLTVTRGDTAAPASFDYRGEAGTATADRDFTLAPGTLTFAAGQSTTSIPVTITNDAAAEPAETVVVILRDPSSGRALASMTLTIAVSDQQPDALISTVPDRGYVGNNIYNTTAAGQTKTLAARRSQTRTFYLRVFNDGTVPSTFSVKGSAARTGSTVRYYTDGTDITLELRSRYGLEVYLAPHHYQPIRVRITVKARAAIGSLKPVTVTGRWVGDGVRQDAVKAAVKVTR